MNEFDDEDEDVSIRLEDIDLILSQFDAIDSTMERFRHNFGFSLSKISKAMDMIDQNNNKLNEITLGFNQNYITNKSYFIGMPKIEEKFNDNSKYVNDVNEILTDTTKTIIVIKNEVDLKVYGILKIFEKIGKYLEEKNYMLEKLSKDNALLRARIKNLEKKQTHTTDLVRAEVITEMLEMNGTKV
tara:strand:- start:795 stop:1352 length:558 start_codon:yes stop_codon:yes gene_type:complete